MRGLEEGDSRQEDGFAWEVGSGSCGAQELAMGFGHLHRIVGRRIPDDATRQNKREVSARPKLHERADMINLPAATAPRHHLIGE